jgi:hypothetical protein
MAMMAASDPLAGVVVDAETRQAIEDWQYWVDRGYEL